MKSIITILLGLFICLPVMGADKDKPFIGDPIVEKAIRKSLKKPEGKLTKADLEKVTKLELWDNQLAEVPKGLENLQTSCLSLGGLQM